MMNRTFLAVACICLALVANAFFAFIFIGEREDNFHRAMDPAVNELAQMVEHDGWSAVDNYCFLVLTHVRASSSFKCGTHDPTFILVPNETLNRKIHVVVYEVSGSEHMPPMGPIVGV